MQPTKRPTGKVQRLILDELNRVIAEKPPGRAYLTSDSLAWRLRAVDLGLDPGDDLPPGQEPSRSDYVSVCRAARELARRGLVSIDKRPLMNERRAAFLWIAAPGSGLEDYRRPGLAETVSRLVAPAIEDALAGDPPRGSKSVGCPAGHVSYRWLAKTLALAVGDRCGEWRIRKAVERGIDKAEERGEIVVVRHYTQPPTGWSRRRPVRLFVSLSHSSETRQQTDETARSVR